MPAGIATAMKPRYMEKPRTDSFGASGTLEKTYRKARKGSSDSWFIFIAKPGQSVHPKFSMSLSRVHTRAAGAAKRRVSGIWGMLRANSYSLTSSRAQRLRQVD